jgi:type I restriction enzyme S subunit
MLCDKTLRLVPKAEVSKNALWHMLQSNRVRQQILAVATGTGAAMKNVSQPKFRALRVCLPLSRNVSEAIEARLDECRRALRECLSRRAACRKVHRTLVNQVLVERAL